jgi:hypothetical protein
MLVSTLIQKGNVGGQSYIPGELLPGKLKSVGRGPHVFAAAADAVSVPGGIVVDRAWMKNRADIPVTLEDSN